MRHFLFLFASLILITCCKKANKTQVLSGTGMIAGSDTTCGGWLIRTSGNTVLDPLNLDSFQVNRKDGQPVIFTYYKSQDAVMICQLGQTVHLVSIQDQ